MEHRISPSAILGNSIKNNFDYGSVGISSYRDLTGFQEC